MDTKPFSKEIRHVTYESSQPSQQKQRLVNFKLWQLKQPPSKKNQQPGTERCIEHHRVVKQLQEPNLCVTGVPERRGSGGIEYLTK